MRRVSAMKAASVGAIQPSTDKLKVPKPNFLLECLFSFSYSCLLDHSITVLFFHRFLFQRLSLSYTK